MAKNVWDLTLSPRCIPAFAAGPSGTVHITYAKVLPSVPVLPPTTLRPKPAAVKRGWMFKEAIDAARARSPMILAQFGQI